MARRGAAGAVGRIERAARRRSCYLVGYGDCLCEAMGCGPASGGTSTTGPLEDTETDGGDPDGCGPFPDGDAGFTCVCEMCSIDVNDVDATWLAGEADLGAL